MITAFSQITRPRPMLSLGAVSGSYESGTYKRFC
jgi:hypothetical protein